MSAPLRIMLLLRSLDLGGAERQAALLARELAKRGHAVTVATFYAGGALEADLDGARVTLAALGKTGRSDVFSFWARLADLVHQARPDVLYSFLTVPNLLAALLRRSGTRPAVVWGVRASDMDMRRYDWLSRLTHALEPHFAQGADLIIANAQSGARAAIARGFPANKLRVVRNGVDLDRFGRDSAKRAAVRAQFGFSDAHKVVGHVARMDAMKDHDTFVAAFARVQRERADIRGLCLTSGRASADVLRARVASAGVGDALHVSGSELDAAHAMSAFDVFCSSSAFGEGFANVLCEALAAGLPCAATSVGDAALVIGDCGALAPPRSPKALGDALSKALALCEDTTFAARARKRAEVFSVDAMVVETERLIRSARARRLSAFTFPRRTP